MVDLVFQPRRLLPTSENWETARVMIQRHGAEAAIFAAMGADNRLDAGDIEGAETWRRVIVAIDALMPTLTFGSEGADTVKGGGA